MPSSGSTIRKRGSFTCIRRWQTSPECSHLSTTFTTIRKAAANRASIQTMRGVSFVTSQGDSIASIRSWSSDRHRRNTSSSHSCTKHTRSSYQKLWEWRQRTTRPVRKSSLTPESISKPATEWAVLAQSADSWWVPPLVVHGKAWPHCSRQEKNDVDYRSGRGSESCLCQDIQSNTGKAARAQDCCRHVHGPPPVGPPADPRPARGRYRRDSDRWTRRNARCSRRAHCLESRARNHGDNTSQSHRLRIHHVHRRGAERQAERVYRRRLACAHAILLVSRSRAAHAGTDRGGSVTSMDREGRPCSRIHF